MAISRAQLLKDMLPTLQELFEDAYNNQTIKNNHMIEVDFEEEPSVVVLDHKNVRPMP